MSSPTTPVATQARYLCLAGPTGSGKTDAALAFAESLATVQPVEIVSVDSALVYRGMDIGTAKPSATERARVAHHLIDLIEPTQRYSVGRFVDDARRCVAAITGRGALPLLVGGTMLYFKALFDGIDAMPASDPAIREDIDREAATLGWPAMHASLAAIDPVTAARLAPTDSQRIQRAIEVWRISGLPLSVFHKRVTAQAVEAPPMVSLEPLARAWLHQRLALRFEQMLTDGFLDEVRRLRNRGDLAPAMPSMRCVGYRQAWQAFDEADGEQLNAPILASLRERAVAATRQLAKRQLTWLRSMPSRQIVACDESGAQATAVRALHAQLELLRARASAP